MKRKFIAAAAALLPALIILTAAQAQEVEKTLIFKTEKLITEKFSNAGGGAETFFMTRKRGRDIMTLVYEKNRQGYFSVNGSEYGPFENDSCRIRTTGPNRWINAKGKDGNMITVNGEVYGPFREVQHMNVSQKTDDWNAAVSDGEMLYLVSGARRRMGPYVALSRDSVVTRDLTCFAYINKSAERYLQYNRTSFGPYKDDNVDINISLSPDGKACGVKMTNRAENGAFEYYTIAGGNAYGPYKNISGFIWGSNSSSWGFRCTDMNDKSYAVIRGEKYGPLQGDNRLLEISGRWLYLYKPNPDVYFVKTIGNSTFGPFGGVPALMPSPQGKHICFTASAAKGEGGNDYFAVIDDVRYGPFSEIYQVLFSKSDDGWIIKANRGGKSGDRMVLITSAGDTKGPYPEIDDLVVGDRIQDYCFSYREEGKDGRFIWMNGPAKSAGPFDAIDHLALAKTDSAPYARTTDGRGWYHITAGTTFGPYESIAYYDRPGQFFTLVRRKGKDYQLVNGTLVATGKDARASIDRPGGYEKSLVTPDSKKFLVNVGGEKFGPYEKAFPAQFSPQGDNWAFAYSDKKNLYFRFKDGSTSGAFDDVSRSGYFFQVIFSRDGGNYILTAVKEGKRHVQLGRDRVMGPYENVPRMGFLGNTNHSHFLADKGDSSNIVIDGKEIAGGDTSTNVINEYYLESVDGRFFYWLSVSRTEGMCLNRLRIE